MDARTSLIRPQLLLLAAATLACATSRPPDSSPPVETPPGQDTPIALAASPKCVETIPGVSGAQLSWTVHRAPQAELPTMRAQLTAFRDGFAREQFFTSWRSDRDTALTVTNEGSTSRLTVEVRDLDAGINYYWRVSLVRGRDTLFSSVARLEAPICPVDSRLDTNRVRQSKLSAVFHRPTFPSDELPPWGIR